MSEPQHVVVRAVEAAGRKPVLTVVEDRPGEHGPGEYVVLERREDGSYVEVDRFP